MPNDVRRCYGMIADSGFGELDTCDVIDYVLEATSWPAVFALIAWVNLGKGHADRVRRCLAKAEALRGSDEDLAYVLHIGSVAYLRMGDLREALDRERRCLAACRKTGDLYLAAHVLVHVLAMSGALGGDSGKQSTAADLEKV